VDSEGDSAYNADLQREHLRPFICSCRVVRMLRLRRNERYSASCTSKGVRQPLQYNPFASGGSEQGTKRPKPVMEVGRGRRPKI
jgi:hypothetical protein